MDTKSYIGQKNQILLFTILGAMYGVICMVLLFSYLQEVSKTAGRLLATSIFVIGGLCGLYALLLSALSKTQQEPDKTKTRHRLSVLSWMGCGIVVILLLLLIMNWVLGAPFDAK